MSGRLRQELREDFPAQPLTEDQVVAYVREKFAARRRTWGDATPDLFVLVAQGPTFVAKPNVDALDTMTFALSSKIGCLTGAGSLMYAAQELLPQGLPPHLEAAFTAIATFVEEQITEHGRKAGS